MKKRKSNIKRKTRETEIKVKFSLDGAGKSNIDTGVPFLDHMLTLFARHGLFDLDLKAKGDLEVDSHHTVEDCGLTLGKALLDALGGRIGIKRFGYAYAPMDETLVRACLDLSGRPNFFFRISNKSARVSRDSQMGLTKIFFKAMSTAAALTLHVDILFGEDTHHMAEGAFKAFSLALDKATAIDKRAKDIPSTKGRF
jgi:imidazoleglycerol-phosphate dehydratase